MAQGESMTDHAHEWHIQGNETQDEAHFECILCDAKCSAVPAADYIPRIAADLDADPNDLSALAQTTATQLHARIGVDVAVVFVWRKTDLSYGTAAMGPGEAIETVICQVNEGLVALRKAVHASAAK
jgi:hypothetical protein